MKSQNCRIDRIKSIGLDAPTGYDPRNSLLNMKPICREFALPLYQPTAAEQHDYALLREELLRNQNMLQLPVSGFLLADLPVTQPDMSGGELAATELVISQFKPVLSKYPYRIYLRVYLTRSLR